MVDFQKLFPDTRGGEGSDLRNAQFVMLRILKIVDFICQENNITYWLDAGSLLGAVRHGGFIPWDDDLDIVMPREDFQKFLSIAVQALPNDLILQTPDTDADYELYGRPPCKIRDKFSLMGEVGPESNSPHKGIFIDIFALDKFSKSGWSKFSDNMLKKVYKNACTFHNTYPTERKGFKGVMTNVIARINRILPSKFVLDSLNLIVNRKIRENLELQENYLIGCGFDIPWIRYYEPEEVYPLKRIKFEDANFNAPNNCDAILKKFYGDYMKLPDEKDRVGHHVTELLIDTR